MEFPTFRRPFNPKFENVPIALDGWNFPCPSLIHMANYLCKKFSDTTYPLAQVHPLKTVFTYSTYKFITKIDDILKLIR